MQRSRFELGYVFASLLMISATGALCLAQGAVVSGVVRDSSGAAQMGVLVQVASAANSAIVGRAFTDLRGHYLVANLVPGRYQVQATAALFSPSLRPNLQLRSGARTVVNLTMSTLFDTTFWLPAERRKGDDASDDWTWTLRSAANRPILRMVENGRLVMVSSSATESHAAKTRGRATMTSGDGGFGSGGLHSVLTTDSAESDGTGVVLRADTGSGRTQFGVGPSTELSAGFERQTGFGSMTRAVASFQSHPELVSAGSSPGLQAGLQTMQLATAQRTKLGDLIEVEAGGTIYGLHTSGYALAERPFLRLTVGPAEGWRVSYRMATSRDLQGFAGLDAVQPELPVVAMIDGRLRTEDGRHQELALARSLGRGQVKVALYKDALKRVSLAGDGSLAAADFASLHREKISGAAGATGDTMTESFRLLVPGYDARGVNAMLTEPLGGGVWAAVEYSTGTGLAPSACSGGGREGLPALLDGMSTRAGQSATVALHGRFPASGTKLRAVYRWQPHSLLTAVDGYREFTDQAFLSFALRQPVRWDGVLPPGLEASVDVTNLLAQGYVPFVSADGRTLFLSQAPRTMRAGLSINF